MSRYDPTQLQIGTEIEMEHTDDPRIAQQIAMDHLNEYEDYYKELQLMEQKLECKKQGGRWNNCTQKCNMKGVR